MTVREMIKELLECDMDLEVTIELETDPNSIYTIAENFKIVNYGSGVVIQEL